MMNTNPPLRLVRHADWPTRLARFIEQRRAKPFAWGEQDCCTFSADAVLCMTDTDPMADLRHVSTAASARRLLKRHPLADLTAERLGAMQSATLTQRGDVVLIEQKSERLLGVCLGGQWAAPGPDGLVFGLMGAAIGSWPVGRVV
jgi:hypothetical protein